MVPLFYHRTATCPMVNAPILRYSCKTLSGRAQRRRRSLRLPQRPNSPQFGAKNYLGGGYYGTTAGPSRDAPTRAPTHAPTPCPTAPLVGPRRGTVRPVRPRRPGGAVLVDALAAVTLLLPRSHVVDSKGYGPGTTWMGRSRKCSR